jgi:preprotein translocase subunit SecA
MPGRRWSDGLHQAVEAKEGVKVEPENVTYATITLQNYFRMYTKLAGMTGTALTEAEEFDKIYKLPVLPIPTNLEFQAFGAGAPLVEVKAKDEEGYAYAYFARNDDPGQEVVFWRRKDYPDIIYRSVEAKLRSLVREIVVYHSMGRPILVGTTSVEGSERLSSRLRAEPVRRLMQILMLRHAWLEKNDRFEDGRIIEELQSLNKPIDQLRPEDLRPMAKDLGLSLNPEDPANLARLVTILGLEVSDEDRLRVVLQAGVSHQVLNARKHTEESQIIAGAGAFGAVTIATNMAGRGVDIKLGGDLAEEVISAVARVLRKAGYKNPYDMSLQARRQALQNTDPALFSIYDAEVKHFLQFFEDMERVRARGGLHVIGSERHEARRIDNQLRGRAARQGDPGSSRFFLSLEDDLMRMFGGEQVKAVMERFKIDDDYPMQHRMVTNMIEQSQHRVEGSNFDVRKHLLEYDDVLNSQRQRIYDQRNRVFEKEDLVEDVNELLVQEVRRRAVEVTANEEFWRFLAWLEQIQPSFNTPNGIFPSYTFKLLLDELNASSADLLDALGDLARRALLADQLHFLNTALVQIYNTGESLDSQVEDRTDALATALDGLADNLENEDRRPNVILDELSGLVRVPFRLDPSSLTQLATGPKNLSEELHAQVESYVLSTNITRLVNTIEFRLGESIGLNVSELQDKDWETVSADMEERLRQVLLGREEKLLGADGQILHDLETALQRLPDRDDPTRLRLLGLISQGTSTSFDSKTHRQVRQVFSRLNYAHLAGELLAGKATGTLEEDVLEHLQRAQEAQRLVWGQSELTRLGENAPTLPTGEIGRRVQSQIYRQVLLGAITELWVDYLTRVEALRVSVGLEAYAQSDPLVKYKSRASEMFQTLLADIRAGVIGRIFLYQPRGPATQVETAAEPKSKPVTETLPTPGSNKKRKRHRH